MHYRVIIVLSGAFILLMTFTIVQQIISFVESRSNPVSSINVIYNEQNRHESAVILMTAMQFSGQSEDRIFLDFEEYHITHRCVCLNSSTNFNTCTNLISMDYNSTAIGSNALLWETPVFDDQNLAVICDHNESNVVFIFVILPEPFDTIRHNWNRMNASQQHEFVDSTFQNHVHSWIHSHFYTNIGLSRIEYYKQHEPESIHITVSSNTARNVFQGQTRVRFMWTENFVTRIDKFVDTRIWSFAMLLCAVLLGLERCYAIITRAKTQRTKQRRKSLAPA